MAVAELVVVAVVTVSMVVLINVRVHAHTCVPTTTALQGIPVYAS